MPRAKKFLFLILFFLAWPNYAAGTFGIFSNNRCQSFLRIVRTGRGLSAKRIGQLMARFDLPPGPEKQEPYDRLLRWEFLVEDSTLLTNQLSIAYRLIATYEALNAHDTRPRDIIWREALEQVALEITNPRTLTVSVAEIRRAIPPFFSIDKRPGTTDQVYALLDVIRIARDLSVYHASVSEAFLKLPLDKRIDEASARDILEAERRGYRTWQFRADRIMEEPLLLEPYQKKEYRERARALATNPKIPYELRWQIAAHVNFILKYRVLGGDRPLVLAVTVGEHYLDLHP